MKRFLSISLLFFFSTCAIVAVAAKVSGFKSTKGESTGYITFRVTSIDYRPDLTRVYGTLVGRPHTSERIDELTIMTPGGKVISSTDIDGVDMKRWFQWEDDGAIEVEIDFPAMKQLKSFTIISKGPKGESRAVITKTK